MLGTVWKICSVSPPLKVMCQEEIVLAFAEDIALFLARAGIIQHLSIV
jgi:hypothetical protein